VHAIISTDAGSKCTVVEAANQVVEVANQAITMLKETRSQCNMKEKGMRKRAIKTEMACNRKLVQVYTYMLVKVYNIYIYIHTYTHAHARTHIHTHIHIHAYIYMHVYMHSPNSIYKAVGPILVCCLAIAIYVI